jgi:hypothetical protein
LPKKENNQRRENRSIAVTFRKWLFKYHTVGGSVTGGDDDDEVGNLGDSNVEGGEADIHNEGLSLRTVLKGSNEVIVCGRNLMLLLEKKKVVVKSVEHQKVGFLLVPLRLGKATSQRLI